MKLRQISMRLWATVLLCLAGTLAFAQPNDDCSGAINVVCGQSYPGSTTNANPSPYSFGSPDLWYRVSNVSGNVRASLCGGGPNWDSKLWIYKLQTGSPECGTIQNMGNNDDFCGGLSQKDFTMQAGDIYYIIVTGVSSIDYGNFTLTVTCNGSVPPPNDLCSNAIATACGSTYVGSTTTASPDPGFTSNGVWYTIQGTGTPITATLCGSSYNTNLVVYSGASCNVAALVGSNDDFCNQQSQYTWSSTVGTTYYILVNGSGTASGNFSLNVQCTYLPVPPNDHCDQAVPVTCGSTTQGTTIGATSDGTYAAPGVWYVIQGTGQPITASMCNTANFDSQIIVLQLVPGTLSCVSGPYWYVGSNDDFCGENAQFTWQSTLGATYYILVNGAAAGDEGEFKLSINCSMSLVPSNDLCVNAIDILCGGDYSGSTVNATWDSNPGTFGVWYHFLGDGSTITVSLCKGASWDTFLYVLYGPCGPNMIIHKRHDDDCGKTGLQSEATFTAMLGIDYYICVGGYGNSTGQFTMSVTGTGCTDMKTNGSPAQYEAMTQPEAAAKTKAAIQDLSVSAFPNPSRDFVEFQVSTTQEGNATLKITDLAGQEIRTIHLGTLEPGKHQFRHDWNNIPAGIYLYQFTQGTQNANGKLQVLH